MVTVGVKRRCGPAAREAPDQTEEDNQLWKEPQISHIAGELQSAEMWIYSNQVFFKDPH